jgi:pyruvate dehydrogenase E2 component (dihydrolipoamide acetyltransferase)
MPVPVIMPKVDMDQEKATLISWSKSEGELVKAEETLLVVETEKVAIDIPSPATGRLAGILYQAGAVVPVATVIAYILKEGEVLEINKTQQSSESVVDTKKPGLADPTVTPPASPLAIKAAMNLGINLKDVPSDGKRVTLSDIEKYVTGLNQQKPALNQHFTDKLAATPAARRTASNGGVDLTNITGSGPRGRIQVADILKEDLINEPVAKADRSYDVIPFIGMRQKIAKKLQSSFQEAPHFSMSIECDMSLIESMRQSLNEKNKEEKVTLTAMIVWVTSWALVKNKILNSSIVGDEIRIWNQINMGVATAVDAGLIVPVIHGADKLDIFELARRLNQLGRNARDGKLELSDVQNGTFTLTNLGMFGIPNFQAVINPPEACILGTGAVIRRPVVLKDSDQIVIRPMMTVTISADHRILDGVVVAKFLNDLKTGLENPILLHG